MTPATRARDHYRRQAALARSAQAAILALWDAVDLADVSGSWGDALDRAVGLLAAGQFAAAAAAAEYVTASLVAQGTTAAALSAPDPRAFAGVAADGRPLGSLLEGARAQTLALLTSGAPASEAVLRGRAFLSLATVNEVQQAGRNADHVAITSSAATGFVRMVTPPCCSRCAVLAGRHYRWSRGFDRHPHCDCVHVPTAEATGVPDIRTDPVALIRDGKVTGLSKAETDAVLNQGADPGQIVNAHRRGMYAYDTTGEGTSIRQGRAGRTIAKASGVDRATVTQDGTVRRLTVRAIYREAAGDRARTLELLARNGYLRDEWTPDFRRSIKSAYADFGIAWAK